MIQTLFGSLNQPEEPEKKSGLFDRMRQAVSRTRESLGERIESVVALTRPVDESALDDLEASLLASDLGSATTTEVINALRQRASRKEIQNGDELKHLLKAELKRILDDVPASPAPPRSGTEVILMVGVNGAGKTTTAGKLAAHFRGQQKSVLLCAADTFRAAAIEQLEVWAERSGVGLIKTRQGGDPSAALFDALEAARARSIDTLIVDTAGRLHTKTNLMTELEKMRRIAQRGIPGAPHQTLLVLDATTGQNGLQQARLFTQSAGVTGIVLTKLDGTAKGGVVIAIARELRLPVRFAGIGEKMQDLIPFDSSAFVESLIEG